MRRTVCVPSTVFVLFVFLSAGAQTTKPNALVPPNAGSVRIVLFGHSWVYRMQGFQPWAFPNLPSQHISIAGYPSTTCAQLLPLLLSNVPANTSAVFIMAATNDVTQHVPVDQHIGCIQNMIENLIGENPHMLIELSNVPPLTYVTQQNLGDLRPDIATYNQAYAALPQQYANNVVVVDMWAPMVRTDGWGLDNMFLDDGIHFGPNGQDTVMSVIRDGLYAGLTSVR
jgi:lysophospholipase L1-like esterase